MKSFKDSARLRSMMTRVNTLDELKGIMAEVDRDIPFPPGGMRVRRGKSSGTQKVSLPEDYLEDLDDCTPPGADAEQLVSGG